MAISDSAYWQRGFCIVIGIVNLSRILEALKSKRTHRSCRGSEDELNFLVVTYEWRKTLQIYFGSPAPSTGYHSERRQPTSSYARLLAKVGPDVWFMQKLSFGSAVVLKNLKKGLGFITKFFQEFGQDKIALVLTLNSIFFLFLYAHFTTFFNHFHSRLYTRNVGNAVTCRYKKAITHFKHWFISSIVYQSPESQSFSVLKQRTKTSNLLRELIYMSK